MATLRISVSMIICTSSRNTLHIQSRKIYNSILSIKNIKTQKFASPVFRLDKFKKKLNLMAWYNNISWTKDEFLARALLLISFFSKIPRGSAQNACSCGRITQQKIFQDFQNSKNFRCTSMSAKFVEITSAFAAKEIKRVNHLKWCRNYLTNINNMMNGWRIYMLFWCF